MKIQNCDTVDAVLGLCDVLSDMGNHIEKLSDRIMNLEASIEYVEIITRRYEVFAERAGNRLDIPDHEKGVWSNEFWNEFRRFIRPEQRYVFCDGESSWPATAILWQLGHPPKDYHNISSEEIPQEYRDPCLLVQGLDTKEDRRIVPSGSAVYLKDLTHIIEIIPCRAIEADRSPGMEKLANNPCGYSFYKPEPEEILN